MDGNVYSPYEQWTRTPITHLEYWGMGPSVGDIYYRSIVVSKYWDRAHLGSYDDEEELFFMTVSVLATRTVSAIITCLPFRVICLLGIKTELRKNNLWLVGLQTARNQMLTA